MELLNEQYDFLIMEYTKRQNKTRHLLEKRYQEITDTIPAIRDLDTEIGRYSMEAATRSFDGDDHALIQLQQEITQIKQQKEKLLISAGYSADYLSPSYKCQDCKDTGYINSHKCHCFKRAIVDFLYSQSNLNDILALENFSTFDITYYPDDYIEKTTNMTPKENMQGVLRIAKDFVEHFHASPGNLLLYGTTGVGKTFLSHCIAKELLDQSHTVVYLTSLALFDILETYKFDRELSAKAKSTKIAYIMDCDLLIIDDLGTELSNSFTSSSLYQCIDSRLVRNRSTIISTNLSFDDLSKRYSERIFSRITSNYSLLKVIGTDIRLKKAIDK